MRTPISICVRQFFSHWSRLATNSLNQGSFGSKGFVGSEPELFGREVLYLYFPEPPPQFSYEDLNCDSVGSQMN